MRNILLTLFISINIFSYAQVELPQLFSEGMVLQRNKPIPVWGWAKAGEQVEIRFKNQVVKTKADTYGKWNAILKPEQAGGPFDMIVKGKKTITLRNVLIGEVWICSGQSNMEFPVSNVINFKEEVKDSDFPMIRQFWVDNDMSTQPKEKLKPALWKACNKNTVGDFTAVGYFFAKEIYKTLNIPIGIINTTWGGICVEAWTSKEAFETSDEFKDMISKMPNIDLDSLKKSQLKLIADRIEKIQGSKIDKSKEINFKQEHYDDANWPEMYAPELWENQALRDLDGTVWMRKHIVISKEDVGKKALLELAKIDDQDSTYVNGIFVGTINQYDQKRSYEIPLEILKEGDNIIAIKVIDYTGGGGIWGDESDFKLILENNIMPLNGNWKYNVVDFKSSLSPNMYPSLLYNAMINPLIPYAIQGVLWYQGEANVNRAQQYKKAFPLMIKDWRTKWKQGDFPFFFVQLSSFDEFGGNSNKGSKWAELREAQSYTLKTVVNTGMAVTTDIGNAKDIHPKNKQDVGKRLASIALNKVYHIDIDYNGPTYKSMEISGNKIILTFEIAGSGLMTPEKNGYLKGFKISGSDKVFHYAIAAIENNKIIVHSDAVNYPIAVRYGWADDAGECNLYNKEEFPASPFRTDDWETITKVEKYSIE